MLAGRSVRLTPDELVLGTPHLLMRRAGVGALASGRSQLTVGLRSRPFQHVPRLGKTANRQETLLDSPWASVTAPLGRLTDARTAHALNLSGQPALLEAFLLARDWAAGRAYELLAEMPCDRVEARLLDTARCLQESVPVKCLGASYPMREPEKPGTST